MCLCVLPSNRQHVLIIELKLFDVKAKFSSWSFIACRCWRLIFFAGGGCIFVDEIRFEFEKQKKTALSLAY